MKNIEKIVFTHTVNTLCFSHAYCSSHPAVHIEGIVLRGVTHSRTDKEYSFQVRNCTRALVSRSFISILDQNSDKHIRTISAI